MLSGCGNDRACSTNADCFSGEICSVDDTCIDREDAVNNGQATNNGQTVNNGQTSNNGQTVNNGQTSNNGQTANNGQSNNGTTTNNGQAPACLVDLFSNTCEDDFWEENDGYDPATSNDGSATPWMSNSWCDANGELPESKRTLQGTLCAGDRGDAFRLVVANAGPVCITSDVLLFRITITLETECDPSLFRVEPYTFGLDPIGNDLCAESEDVRCTVSDDGQTHVVEWLFRDQQQYYDASVQLMSESDNLQLDYSLEFEIIPQ